MTWLAVAAVAIVCVVLRVAAPLALRGKSLPGTLERRLDWAVAPLLTGLVALQLFDGTASPDLDARTPGLAAGALVFLWRRSVIAALLAATVVTAGLQGLG